MQVLLKESDGTQVGKEWQGEAGRGYVRQPDAEVLSIVSQVALSIDDTGETYALPANKTGASFQNLGSTVVWYGDSNINPTTSRGHKLLPNQMLTFRPARAGFSIFFKMATGETGTLGLLEYAAS